MLVETFRPPSSDSPSPSSPRPTTRYRASCDRCQIVKVKCSQDKPVCTRCDKKDLACVYSPLGRMGRPRKREHRRPSLSAFAGADFLSSRLVTPTTPQVDGFGDVYNLLSTNSSSDHTSSSTPQTGAHASPSCATEPSSIESRKASVSGYPQWPRHPWQQSQSHMHEYLNGSDEQQALNSDPVQLGREASARICGVSTSQQPDLNTSMPETNCHVSILTAITNLERILNSKPLAPPIDLVLATEKEFRELKHGFLNCVGHLATDACTSGMSVKHCQVSDRPVLLSLTLLAERVVAMLQQLFYLAAVSAHAVDRAMQDSSWSSMQLPNNTQRRLERSFRSLLDQPCAFPVPSAGQDIRIGDYVIDGQAKARALKRILQLRIRKLLGALEDLRDVPHQHSPRTMSSGPLDWGDSRAAFGDATEILVEDMIRRLEALQGGMALVE